MRAFIFDLDGTLVETELLKARAYAIVAADLLRLPAPDERAIALYRRLVGSTDETVSRAMVVELKLAPALQQETALRGGEPWEALHRLRMATYRAYVGTPEALRANAYWHNIAVLRDQRAAGRKVAVATSSFQDEAVRVLAALGLSHDLDLILGRDTVSKPKPDPEIYLKAMSALDVTPYQTVIIEDSPIGLAAAIASGARWVCVATDFSAQALKAYKDLDQRWVVYDPAHVKRVVEECIRRSP